MSQIELYRNQRLRQQLQQQIATRQTLCQTPQTLYPYPIQPSEIQQYQTSTQATPTYGAIQNSVENRLWLIALIIAVSGASIALILMSIGGMVSTIARSGMEPAPNVWIRTEQIRSQ